MIRKLAIILTIMSLSFAASSQTLNPFPTTDSLRKFINKWIRNSPIDAFTNLRLNTSLIGMSRFLDSAYGGQVTGLTYSDDTLRLSLLGGQVLKVEIEAGLNQTVGNGVTNTGDSIVLGGILDRYTWIQVKNNRQQLYSDLQPNAVLIGNQRMDTSMINYIFPNPVGQNPYGKSNLYLLRYHGDNDTLYMSYGSPLNAWSLVQLKEGNTRHNTQSKPILLPYGGYDGTHQLMPPDSAQWQTSPYGHTSVYAGDFGLGDTTNYWINTYSSGLTPAYPVNVARMGFDFARRSYTVKREVVGGPIAIYVADWRSQGGNITSGTTDYGSYVNKVVGFYAHGNLNAHLTSPSKAKTLAVSKIDSAIALFAPAMYTDKNETDNGYFFVSDGDQDMSHLKGRMKIGTTRPYRGETGIAQFMVDSTVLFGKNNAQGAYFINNQVQTGVTPANLSTKKAQSFYNSFDWSFSQPTDISNKFVYPVLSRLWLRADSAQPVYQNVFGNGVAASSFGLYLRKNSGYLDTTYFIGPNDPNQVAPAIEARLDVSDAGLASTRPKIMTGIYSMFSPQFSINDWNFLRGRLLWSVWGQSFYGGSNRAVDTSTYIYMLPQNAIVGTKYAVQQTGDLDSNIWAGPSRFTNNITRVGSAAAIYTTSTTSLGASSGGISNIYTQDLPSASTDRLGIINFGSAGGAANDYVGASISGFANGSWTGGSSHFSRLIFSTTNSGSATPSEVMRISNSRVSIGTGTTGTAFLTLRAGTSGANGAPLKFTAGTNQVTPESGTVEYDGQSFFFTPSTIRLRTVLSNNVIPGDGQVAVGNGNDYTVSDVFAISTVTTTGTTTLSGTIKMHTIKIDATGGAVTVTLTANHPGQVVNVKRMDNSGNTITVQGSVGNIDGSASVTLTSQYQSQQLQWDGSNWNIL